MNRVLCTPRAPVVCLGWIDSIFLHSQPHSTQSRDEVKSTFGTSRVNEVSHGQRQTCSGLAAMLNPRSAVESGSAWQSAGA